MRGARVTVIMSCGQLVLAQDMFDTKFGKAEGGVLDKQAGRDYRYKVLAPGGSRPALELVTNFLGRKPNNDAFLRSLGLGDGKA